MAVTKSRALTRKQIDAMKEGDVVRLPEGTTNGDVPVVRAVHDGAPEEYLPWVLYTEEGQSHGKIDSALLVALEPERA